MNALVIAKHNNASVKGATLNTAVVACDGAVHVQVAGHNAGEAAKAAAQTRMSPTCCTPTPPA